MFKRFNAPYAEPLTPHALTSALHAAESAESTIAEGVSIKGSLHFEGVLRIDGHFEGEIHSTGTLIIGPSGVVISDLHLSEAVISGKVQGNITVKNHLHLKGKAQIEGDICAPLLSVEEGVSLKGTLHIAAHQTPSYDHEHYESEN